MAINYFNVPYDKPLLKGGANLPLVIVADEACSLKPYLLRPYNRQNIAGSDANKIFNNGLSRARRVVGNVFGIFSAMRKICLHYFEKQPDIPNNVITATCCLNNMLSFDNHFELEIAYANNADECVINISAVR